MDQNVCYSKHNYSELVGQEFSLKKMMKILIQTIKEIVI